MSLRKYRLRVNFKWPQEVASRLRPPPGNCRLPREVAGLQHRWGMAEGFRHSVGRDMALRGVVMGTGGSMRVLQSQSRKLMWQFQRIQGACETHRI